MKPSQFHIFLLAALLAIASGGASAAATPPTQKAKNDRVEIRVEPLSRKQVKQRFVSGLHEDYLVVKVTLVPKTGADLLVSRDQFSLQDQDGEAAAAQKPEALADELYRKQDSRREVTVVPTTEIGYSSGTDRRDPRWSGDPQRRRKGVYYSTGVGVGVGSGPRLTPKDREVMELELGELALPEGPTSQPVSGHLYFAVTLKKGSLLRLTYQDETGSPLTVEFKRP